MGNLYLINKEYGENGLKLAEYDGEAVVVLIQDGVYIDPALYPNKAKIYAIKQDVQKRGLNDRLHKRVECIDYSQLVDLIVENKVINFA
ncbi:MAG TPA: DsrH/TusB family sulfur relay protein [Candidatus Hypogeohydataceae bacterium YC41]